MRNSLRLAVAAVVLTAAPAQASTFRSGLHDYVLGRQAWSESELGRASGHFANALAHAPDDPVLLRRTFDLAMAAGDQALASKLAARLEKSERYDTTLALLRATEALQKRNWNGVDAARRQLTDAGFAAFAAPVIEAWTLHGRGKTDEALAKLDSETQEGFAKAYVAEHRAHLLAADKRWDEAAAMYQTLFAGEGLGSSRLRLAAAGALQAGKRRDEARRLLEAGGSDPATRAALEQLAANRPVAGAIRTPREGVAELFTRMSVDLSRERPLPISLTLARLATFLAPESGGAWLTVADVLARGGQYDAALGALGKVKPDDPLVSMARARRAAILLETERAQDAVALLEKATGSDASFDDWSRLGEAYQRIDRYQDAVRAFDRAIALIATETPEHWYLYFARGAAYFDSGDWPRAEADLRHALKLAPKEAAVLNYLGYALLDRGERLGEAQAMIEQAVQQQPDSGHIIDSLGWLHYRAGRYAKAVETLERAVAEVPDDPTINDHLGDAYWKVGRRLEARHRWQAALDGEPDDEMRKRIATKLDFGLDMALAANRP